MKKLFATTQLIIIGLLLQMPVSFAATATAPIDTIPVVSPAPITTAIAPAPTTAPSPETAPVAAPTPTRTSPPALRVPPVSTKEPAPTTTGSTTPTPTGTVMGTTPAPTPQPGSNLTSNVIPAATDIPTVPTFTQETSRTPSTICDPNSGANCEVKVEKKINKQVLIGTYLSTGTFIGGSMWMISLLMMKGGVVSRAAGSMQRENRWKLNKMYTAKKLTAYNKYIDSVMSMINKLHHKNGISNQDTHAFKESAAFIEINGSKHLRALNDRIAGLVNSGKSLAGADHLQLKTDLTKIMKADLAMA